MIRILVIGDSCIDQFVYGSVSRICQEAPVPIFNPISKVVTDGMASNVYRNILAIDKSIEVELLTNPIKPVKTRYVEVKSNQMLLRVDDNDNVERCNLDRINFSEYSGVIVSDYSKGFLLPQDLKYIAEHSKLSFLDTKKKLGLPMTLFTYVKVNKQEWINSKDIAIGFNWGKKLIVTLGEDGCYYEDKNYPVESKVIGGDISGAGDTFLATFAYFVIMGSTPEEAIVQANRTASYVVTQKGVSTI